MLVAQPDDGANDRQFVGHPGQARQQLAKADSRHPRVDGAEFAGDLEHARAFLAHHADQLPDFLPSGKAAGDRLTGGLGSIRRPVTIRPSTRRAASISM